MPTLNWIGKEKVVTHHNDVPFRVLNRKYTFGDTPNSGNMIIHGDNLEALKALLPEYEGRIKCIYIDPPYNTGEEKWTYNDNVNDPSIRKWLGEVVGKETDDLTRHDKWLCMMYPRLVLLYKLLADDGAIFISLDDNEIANLRCICNEIFGISNFITDFIWHKKIRPSNKLVDKEGNASLGISANTEHIVCYAKKKEHLLFNIDSISEEYIKTTYRNPDKDPRGPWRTAPLWADSNTNKEKTLILDDGTELTKKWFVNQDTLNLLYANDLIYKAKGSISKKIFLSDALGQAQMNFLDADRFGTSEEGTKEYKLIMDSANFTNPKSIRLLEHIVSIIHSSNDAIILDSFAGSGTTAHAVLNLNKRDGGRRRFILCELGDYADSITAERVRRVISGYGNGKSRIEGTGGSFDFYELGETIFDPVSGNLNDNADAEAIRRYVWFSETNSAYVAPSEDAHPFLLGSYQHNNYYFFYIKGEETCLDWDFLNTFTQKDKAEMYIIYADRCVLTEEEMIRLKIRFKKIPRDIKRL